eukprot:CAMPEP_0181288084 /NCGR_PEP_ID=MMETSP1101-20121128/138_1 /TAXON_ID=46948 /ORGANISM="Rhodomonas abbreviata, Strain Caron Lab Isolate" /LENGTH=327 /DNA_ID=CAMNT_0023392171 /DNA_START=15 /DNA_END=998 /DNA_ORIENTATION=+
MTDTIPCRFFQQGRCTAGRQCKFSHNPAVLKMQPTKAPCKFFQKGTCTAGDACQYAHFAIKKEKEVNRPSPISMVPKPVVGVAIPSKNALKSSFGAGPRPSRLHEEEDLKYETESFLIGEKPAEQEAGAPAYAAIAGQGVEYNPSDYATVIMPDHGPVSEDELRQRKELRERVARSAEEECGICMEQVQKKGSQFGLLDGCSHVFCVECIREWRTVGQLDKSVKRSCPLCRCESHYVIPCSFVPSNETEKCEVVITYQERLKKIPCRHFDQGRGECPFGTSCFYEHRFKDGTLEQGAAPRFKLSDDGVSEAVGKMKLSDMIQFREPR